MARGGTLPRPWPAPVVQHVAPNQTILGDGWQIGTGPTNTYDWNAPSGEEWTVPVQLALAKTTAIGDQIVKLNFSIEKNVVRPDAFAEDWTATFTFSPVVKNPFQPNPPAPPVDEVTRAALLSPVRQTWIAQ